MPVIGAFGEDSAAKGICGTPSGATYVFVDDGSGSWRQQAYLKASNTDAGDTFGVATTVSADGSLRLVGAPWEDSHAIGIDGDELSAAAPSSGAVYSFRRDQANLWAQQSYIKAPNTDEGDEFGASVAVTADGDALAFGTPKEDGKWPADASAWESIPKAQILQAAGRLPQEHDNSLASLGTSTAKGIVNLRKEQRLRRMPIKTPFDRGDLPATVHWLWWFCNNPSISAPWRNRMDRQIASQLSRGDDEIAKRGGLFHF